MNSQFFLYVIYSSSSTSTRSRQIHLQGLVLNHLLINFHSRCWHQQTIRDKGDVRMALHSPLVATSKWHKRTEAIIKIDLGFQGRQSKNQNTLLSKRFCLWNSHHSCTLQSIYSQTTYIQEKSILNMSCYSVWNWRTFLWYWSSVLYKGIFRHQTIAIFNILNQGLAMFLNYENKKIKNQFNHIVRKVFLLDLQS